MWACMHRKIEAGEGVGWGRELWTRPSGSTLMNQKTTTSAKASLCRLVHAFQLHLGLQIYLPDRVTRAQQTLPSLWSMSAKMFLYPPNEGMVFLINWWHCILRCVSHSTQGKPWNSSKRNAPEIRRNYSPPLSSNTKPNIIKLSSYIKMLQRKQPT